MISVSLQAIKYSFHYILSNFGKLWILLLKVIVTFVALTAVLLFLVVGITGSKTFDTLSTSIKQYQSELTGTTATEEINTLLSSGESAPGAPTLDTEAQEDYDDTVTDDAGLSGLQIITLSTSAFLFFVALFFAASALMSNIIRSVMGKKALETTFFKRWKDQDVRNYLKGFVMVIAPLFIAIPSISALTMLHSAFGILFVIFTILLIPYTMRTMLIPIAWAVGDATSLCSSWTVTKGNGFKVFFTYLFSVVALVAFFMAYAFLQSLIISAGSMALTISMVITVVALAFIPLQLLPGIAFVHLYKNRQTT